MTWAYAFRALFVMVALLRLELGRRKAIKLLTESQETHALWIEYLTKEPEYKHVNLVGDLAHQKQWMTNYDHIIAMMRPWRFYDRGDQTN
ncbi:hypothetical protein LCGC14_1332100 [marine sediment metagenome]|uniref:Uncharacterized protein n=1 Tax=marine sediment metagenome TaxID=412755 RepID=A0A0F9NIP7_9ZZZZ